MKWERDDTNYRRTASANDNPETRGPYEEWLLESSLGARHMIRRHFFKDDAKQNILVFGGGNGVDGFEASLPLRSNSLPDEDVQVKIDAGYDKEVVRIAAVIDDSFNFMNRRFTYQSDEGLSSRFAKVWVQDADHWGQKFMKYGRVLSAKEITRMIRAVEGGKAEEDVLQEFGLISEMDENYLPSAMRGHWSHGTHIADLFAGLPPDHRDARGTALLAVQLPPMATYDTSGLTLTGVVMDAIEFIFEHAKAMSAEIGKPLPLVLNFSYGFTGGPRTGRTMLEQKLFNMATDYKRSCKKLKPSSSPEVDLVIPCGNSRLSQTHVIARETGGKIALTTAFRVQPNDETSSFLELWAPTGTSKFRFTFEAPGAAPLTGECELDEIGAGAEAPEEQGKIAFNLKKDGEVVARVRHDRPFQEGTSKDLLDYLHRFVVSIAPTQPLNDDHAAAPHGLWRCEITCDAPEGAAIEGWILRDERVAPTPPRCRQAYFEDPGAAESTFDERGALSEEFKNSPQSRDRTISNLASTGLGAKDDEMHPKVHVVAGVYAGDETTEAPYKVVSDEIAGQISPASISAEKVPYSATWQVSGAPSTVNGYCDAKGPISGLPGEGVREGASIRLNGTSVAAPRVARTFLFKDHEAAPDPTSLS